MDNSIFDPLAATSDPTISANIASRAGQTNAQVANSYAAPAQEASRGLLNSHDNFNNGLSYGDQATSAAIKSRYLPQQNQAANQLKIDTMKNADADHIRNLQTATAAAGQEVELNKQKALLKWKIDQADKKARGAILGTTLGIVGGVVAGVYTGGTGAAAGYAAGQGIGQAAGGM